MNNNKEKAFLIRKASTTFAIIFITLALFIVPWIIYQYIPAISSVLGYTGESFCTNPYVYIILIGIATVLSVFSMLLSWLLVKGPSHWKVFMIFEAVVLLNTLIAAFLNSALCDGRPWKFL